MEVTPSAWVIIVAMSCGVTGICRARKKYYVSEIVAISDGQIAVVQRAVLVNVDHGKVRQNRDFVENPMRRAAVE